MHTHTDKLVLVTANGQPFRPSHAIACTWPKSELKLRIVMDTGEVIQDHWSSPEDALEFMSRVRYAMQGLVHVPDPETGARPVWATPVNATIAADSAISDGCTLEHAAQVYARVLFGEGSPPLSIDGAHMEAAFDSVVGTGLVSVYAGMPDPSHSHTIAPFTVNSPLVRMAILAADHGVDPHQVVFGPSTESKVDDDSEPALTMPKIVAALTTGEGPGRSALAHMACPRKSYTYCSLNRRFFGDWVGMGGPLVLHEHPSFAAEFDADNADHVAVLTRLADHLEASGHSAAGSQLRSELPTS